MLQKWLIDGNWRQKQAKRSFQFDSIQSDNIAKEEARKKALGDTVYQEFAVGAKSQNTNSFGLNQYIVVARDGSAWRVHRSVSYPWRVNQIIQVPLVKGEPNWGAMNVEVPQRISNPAPELLEEIWSLVA